MSRLREVAARVSGFLTGRAAGPRRSADRELDDELQFHLEMTERQLREQGMTPDEARREARVRFGGVSQIAEAHRDQRTLPRLESLMQDVRFGIRMLARSPGFTLAALLTLALGIGANTAIFSIVNTVLLRPLPYTDPDRLVMVGDREPNGGASTIGFRTFADFRDRNRSFEHLAALRTWSPTLVANGEAERLPAMRISWNYFATLGVGLQLGRDFRPDEDRPDHWRVVILSDGLWRRRFGADPGLVGRTVTMNGVAFQVVGVARPDFEPLVSARFFQPAQLWAPLGYDTSQRDACRTCRHLRAIGRVRQGVATETAIADLDHVRAQLAAEHPTDYPAGQMAAVPLAIAIAGPVRTPLLVLLGAVGFVMLIACANVANLQLSRSVRRSREMAVRAALGAGRGRLVRQLLTESTILSLAGGALGLVAASVFVDGIAASTPVSIPRADRVQIDRWVLAFSSTLSVLTGVAFGLIPALRASGGHLRSSLHAGSRTAIGTGSTRARNALVVVDLALALVLLTGAGLMLRSVSRLMEVDPGFNPRGVLTAQFSLVGDAYREDSAVHAFQQQALEKLRALPGVEAVAITGQVPMGGNWDTRGFHIEGHTRANPAEAPSVQRYSVTPDYFRVMSIPVRRGRLLAESDAADAVPVIVVSESAAKLWSGEDPIGRRVRVGGPAGTLRTVVGIVPDLHHTELDDPGVPQAYLPQAQLTDSFLVVAVKASPEQLPGLRPAMRGTLRALDPTVPFYNVETADDLLAKSFAERRFVMRLLSAFAAVAVLLAAIGLYGVVSHTVAQRTREVGVRLALGARGADILRLILLGGARTLATGLAAGLLAALAMSRVLDSMLFGVGATDPIALAAAVATLVAVALVAHLIPAGRALRVDPAIALRQE